MTRIPELEQELVAAARRLQSPRRLLRPGWRWALAGAAVGVVVVLAVLGTMETNDADRRSPPAGTVPAPGAKVVVTDVVADIQWSLDGRVLTVRLLPDSLGRTLRRVSGARISATCGTNITATPGEPPRETTLTRLWPAGQTSLSYRFPRDVSRWCQLEDQPGSIVAFVKLPGASPGARELITETASNWARLFASNAVALTNVDTETEIPNPYMAQPALEQMYCQRDEAPIPNCTPPSVAYQQSFRAATVQEIAIKGDRAAARFSNGETIELDPTDRGWQVDKFGENAGRGFFK